MHLAGLLRFFALCMDACCARIVRNPSDRVKTAYGVETHEELSQRAREIRTQLLESNQSAEGRTQLFAELDRFRRHGRVPLCF